MALLYKVYDADGLHIASTRYAEDASFIMPEKGKLKVAGHIVWREGNECIFAGESADHFACIVNRRTGLIS